MLANLEDIRTHLAEDKLEVETANTAKFQIEATRIIKSSLSGVFTATTLFSWNAPDVTPKIIRSIAGELIAAFLYRQRYAEDSTDVPEYAQTLYNEAIGRLTEIRLGTLAVLDDNDVAIDVDAADMDSEDFWPNDTTPGPYFAMEQRL